MILLVVGVPLTAILAGILLNRSEVRELRHEMVVRFDKLGRNDRSFR